MAVGRGLSAGTVFFTKCFEIPMNTEPTDKHIKILLNNVVNIILYRVLLTYALRAYISNMEK